MKEHPLGIVCTRGVHAEEIVYSPDRLRVPMKRVGERGEGRLEPISWEEAFERSATLRVPIHPTVTSISQTGGPSNPLNSECTCEQEEEKQ